MFNDFGQINPFVVGNFSFLAAWENDQEEKVNRLVRILTDPELISKITITKDLLEQGFNAFEIDYPNLPQYLKDKIDLIDIED